MRKINPGVWVGIVMMVFSIVFLFLSMKFPYSSALGPGPGFFPLWLSGILAVVSLLYIYESIKGENASEEEFPDNAGRKRILIILSNCIIFVVLFPNIGFILSTIVFLFVLLIREYKWYSTIGISVGTSLFLFWLFNKVLSVPLPTSVFGF